MMHASLHLHGEHIASALEEFQGWTELTQFMLVEDIALKGKLCRL